MSSSTDSKFNAHSPEKQHPKLSAARAGAHTQTHTETHTIPLSLRIPFQAPRSLVGRYGWNEEK